VECFPTHLYGSLTGFVTVFAFFICLLSFALAPLTQITFQGNNNYVFLILLIPSFSFYYFIQYFKEASECAELISGLHHEVVSTDGTRSDTV